MLLFRIPGVRRTRSGVWWLTVSAMLLAAAVIVGLMVVAGR